MTTNSSINVSISSKDLGSVSGVTLEFTNGQLSVTDHNFRAQSSFDTCLTENQIDTSNAIWMDFNNDDELDANEVFIVSTDGDGSLLNIDGEKKGTFVEDDIQGSYDIDLDQNGEADILLTSKNEKITTAYSTKRTIQAIISNPELLTEFSPATVKKFLMNILTKHENTNGNSDGFARTKDILTNPTVKEYLLENLNGQQISELFSSMQGYAGNDSENNAELLNIIKGNDGNFQYFQNLDGKQLRPILNNFIRCFPDEFETLITQCSEGFETITPSDTANLLLSAFKYPSDQKERIVELLLEPMLEEKSGELYEALIDKKYFVIAKDLALKLTTTVPESGIDFNKILPTMVKFYKNDFFDSFYSQLSNEIKDDLSARTKADLCLALSETDENPINIYKILQSIEYDRDLINSTTFNSTIINLFSKETNPLPVNTNETNFDDLVEWINDALPIDTKATVLLNSSSNKGNPNIYGRIDDITSILDFSEISGSQIADIACRLFSKNDDSINNCLKESSQFYQSIYSLATNDTTLPDFCSKLIDRNYANRIVDILDNGGAGNPPQGLWDQIADNSNEIMIEMVQKKQYVAFDLFMDKLNDKSLFTDLGNDKILDLCNTLNANRKGETSWNIIQELCSNNNPYNLTEQNIAAYVLDLATTGNFKTLENILGELNGTNNTNIEFSWIDNSDLIGEIMQKIPTRSGYTSLITLLAEKAALNTNNLLKMATILVTKKNSASATILMNLMNLSTPGEANSLEPDLINSLILSTSNISSSSSKKAFLDTLLGKMKSAESTPFLKIQNAINKLAKSSDNSYAIKVTNFILFNSDISTNDTTFSNSIDLDTLFPKVISHPGKDNYNLLDKLISPESKYYSKFYTNETPRNLNLSTTDSCNFMDLLYKNDVYSQPSCISIFDFIMDQKNTEGINFYKSDVFYSKLNLKNTNLSKNTINFIFDSKYIQGDKSTVPAEIGLFNQTDLTKENAVSILNKWVIPNSAKVLSLLDTTKNLVSIPKLFNVDTTGTTDDAYITSFAGLINTAFDHATDKIEALRETFIENYPSLETKIDKVFNVINPPT